MSGIAQKVEMIRGGPAMSDKEREEDVVNAAQGGHPARLRALLKDHTISEDARNLAFVSAAEQGFDFITDILQEGREIPEDIRGSAVIAAAARPHIVMLHSLLKGRTISKDDLEIAIQKAANPQAKIYLVRVQKNRFPSPQAQPQSCSRPSADTQEFDNALKMVLAFDQAGQLQTNIANILVPADEVLKDNPQSTFAFTTKVLCLMIQGQIISLFRFLETSPLRQQIIGLVKKNLPYLRDVLEQNPNHLGALKLRTGASILPRSAPT